MVNGRDFAGNGRFFALKNASRQNRIDKFVRGEGLFRVKNSGKIPDQAAG
jgi:hypothetical protein